MPSGLWELLIQAKATTDNKTSFLSTKSRLEVSFWRQGVVVASHLLIPTTSPGQYYYLWRDLFKQRQKKKATEISKLPLFIFQLNKIIITIYYYLKISGIGGKNEGTLWARNCLLLNCAWLVIRWQVPSPHQFNQLILMQ